MYKRQVHYIDSQKKYLHGQPSGSLPDVGSGRGALLWPFMQAFKLDETNCIDLLTHRVQYLMDTVSGDVPNLTVVQ